MQPFDFLLHFGAQLLPFFGKDAPLLFKYLPYELAGRKFNANLSRQGAHFLPCYCASDELQSPLSEY